MKVIVFSVLCILLAGKFARAQPLDIDPGNDNRPLVCAIELVDRVNDRLEEIITTFTTNWELARGAYSDCDTMTEPQRTYCRQAFSELVIGYVRSLEPTFDNFHQILLAFVMENMEDYMTCRMLRMSGRRPTICAEDLLERVFVDFADEYRTIVTFADQLSEDFESCVDRAVDDQAECLVDVFNSMFEYGLNFIAQIRGDRDDIIYRSLNPLEEYYQCRYL